MFFIQKNLKLIIVLILILGCPYTTGIISTENETNSNTKIDINTILLGSIKIPFDSLVEKQGSTLLYLFNTTIKNADLVHRNIGYSVQQTTDNGFIICGLSSNGICQEGFLLKTNNNGDEIWNKTYHAKGDTLFYSITQTNDNGFIIVGATYDGQNLTTKMIVIKTDEYGTIIWNKTFDSYSFSYGTNILQTIDGGFIISGMAGESYLYCMAMLIKIDINGKIEWEKLFDFSEGVMTNNVQQTKNQEYILSGTFGKPWDNSKIFLLKTCDNCTEIWRNTYHIMDSSISTAVRETYDEGFIITGYSMDFTEQKEYMILIKTNNTGIEEWNNSYENHSASSIEPTDDQGFLIGGTTWFNNAAYAFLLKTDKYGSINWEKQYEGLGISQSMNMNVLEDEGYILTGLTSSSSENYYYDNCSIFLSRTDKSGNEQWWKSYAVPCIQPGYVKFYGWDESNTIHQYTVTIGGYGSSHGSSAPIGYYETQYFGLCPGSYKYKITWFGRESSNSTERYISIKENEYKAIKQNLTFCDDYPQITIKTPENALYINNKKIIPLRNPVIIGPIDILINASDASSNIDYVECFIDDSYQMTDSNEPYVFLWSNRSFGKHTITIISFDEVGYESEKRILVRKFF